MDNIQTQMNTILQDPEMMSRIMSMAQSLSGGQSSSPPKEEYAPNISMPEIDLETVQKLSGFLMQSNIDSNQQTLLSALTPYLNAKRIAKLEKAMRAAKLANLASSLLANASTFNIGR